MGIVPKEETKRNKDLIADYLKGDQKKGWKYTISELGVRYARIENGKTIPLTATRIHQILNRHGVKKQRVPNSKKKSK